MDNKTIFTKTAKGVSEAVGKTRVLSRDLRTVLKEVDGKASLDELIGKIGTLSEAKLYAALNKLNAEDYIREFSLPALDADTLDFSTILPLPAKTTRPPSQKTRINQAVLMQLEARAKAEVEAYERLEREQQELERQAEEAQALRKEEEKAKRAAQQQAMKAAQESARQEAEERAKRAVEDEARRQAEQQARHEAEEAAKRAAALQAEKDLEERARQQAEEQARLTVEEQARLEAEKRAKQAAEEQARLEAETAKKALEDRLRRDAEEQARLIAEQQALKIAEEQARHEAEEQARKDAEAEARRLAEDQARKEAEEAARREAEPKVRWAAGEEAKKRLEALRRQQAEAQARQEEEERIRLEAEERARQELEEQARREAEKQARIDAEAEARRLAEERARKEVEERARHLAEEQARIEREESRRKAEAKARKEAEEAAQREAQEQARREREAQAEKEADDLRRQAEAKARQDEEEKARRDAEDRAKKKLEEQAQREAAQRKRQEAEEKARRDAKELAEKNAADEIQREFEKLEREQAEAAARQKAEVARRQMEEAAQRKAEAKAKKDNEARARREAEEAEAQREAELKAKQDVEQWQRDAEKAEKKKARKDGKKKKRSPEPEKQFFPNGEEQAEQDNDEQIDDLAREYEEQDVSESEPIEQDAEKKSFFKSSQKAYRKPINWGKPAALVLSLSALLGLGLIHVISFDSRMALFEKAATAQFQQPVKIGTMHLSLLPQPHWRLEDVVIGAEPQITVSRINATTSLSSLFSDDMAFKLIELESPAFSEEALESLLFSRTRQRNIAVDRIIASNAKLISKNIALPLFNARGAIGPNGSWNNITVDSLDGKTRVSLQPDGEAVRLELTADSFEMPFGSTLVLDGLTAKGTARRNEITITDFTGSVYGGSLGGTAKLQWGTNWSLTGNVQAKMMDVAQFAPELLQSGKLEGNAAYALRAEHADKLFAASRVEGLFTVRNGTLTGVDFAKLLRNANSSGKSSFAELTGAFVQEGGKIQLQRVYVGAGLLSVRGNADIDVSKNVSGRFTVELKSPSQQARSNLVVSGTLREPRFNQ